MMQYIFGIILKPSVGPYQIYFNFYTKKLTWVNFLSSLWGHRGLGAAIVAVFPSCCLCCLLVGGGLRVTVRAIANVEVLYRNVRRLGT